jgi:hypothetical protein
LTFLGTQINDDLCDIMLGQFGRAGRSVNSRENKDDRIAKIGKKCIFCKTLKLLDEDESISIGRAGQLVNICKISKISYLQSFIYANV